MNIPYEGSCEYLIWVCHNTKTIAFCHPERSEGSRKHPLWHRDFSDKSSTTRLPPFGRLNDKMIGVLLFDTPSRGMFHSQKKNFIQEPHRNPLTHSESEVHEEDL